MVGHWPDPTCIMFCLAHRGSFEKNSTSIKKREIACRHQDFWAFLKNKIGKSDHIGPAPPPHGNDQLELFSLSHGACALQVAPAPSTLKWPFRCLLSFLSHSFCFEVNECLLFIPFRRLIGKTLFVKAHRREQMSLWNHKLFPYVQHIFFFLDDSHIMLPTWLL